jgi:hypothetical protein
MKHFLFLLTMAISSSAFSTEHLSSIGLEDDLGKLPKSSIIKFNKDIKFRNFSDLDTEFTNIDNKFKTSQGSNLMCTLRSKQGHPGLEHNAVIPADSIVKVKSVSRRGSRISPSLGAPYTIELDAETPERVVPLVIRCMRRNIEFQQVDNLPSDLTIQDFIEKGGADFNLTLSESSEDEQKANVTPEIVKPIVLDKPAEPQQKPIEIMAQAIPVITRTPKPVEYREIKTSKTVVSCRVEDESNKETLPFDAIEDSRGNVSVNGSYKSLGFQLTFSTRGSSNSELVVQTGNYSFSKSLPGLGAIEFKSGMMSRLMGAKNNFRVECYPSSRKVITESRREIIASNNDSIEDSDRSITSVRESESYRSTQRSSVSRQ